MDEYIKNYDQYSKNIVYFFQLHYGGIGDYIKYFMYALSFCIKYKYKCYFIRRIPIIEKYLKLKYKQMYIEDKNITNFINIGEDDIPNVSENIYNFVQPLIFYKNYKDHCIDFNIQEVFEFSDEVITNSHKLLSKNISNYISVHLRLGDKFLETDKNFVTCPNDERTFNENDLFNFIETNMEKNIIFFCDNNCYKLKIKKKYNNVIITNSEIGHTGLDNTTDKQALDTITELYLLSNSEKIYYASISGFSFVASKFKNIPLIKIC
jgi:hypothetical protein